MLAPGQRLKADRYEAMVALRVTHPNVLVPRDTFVDGSLAVLVLELCAGSMADVLAEHDALTAEQAFALLEGPLAAGG